MGLRHAFLRGAGGLGLSLFLAWVFSWFLDKAFGLSEAWHWVDLFRPPPPLAKLLQSRDAFEANLEKLFEIIFIIAVLVSVFAQQTISHYFRLNKFDLYCALVVRWPTIARGTDRRFRISLTQYGKTVPAEKFLKLSIIIIALNIIASFSIIAVGNFLVHVATTLLYLLLVFALDLGTWLFTDELVSCNTVYRGIRPYRLFRYMNRQLLFTIDSGIAVIFIIVALGWIGGYADNAEVPEKAFFTGVVSFYLISTCILIVYLLYEWRAILSKNSVVD